MDIFSLCEIYSAFPHRHIYHKNHTKRARTWETKYFCPMFFPIYCLIFPLAYFLQLLNISEEIIIYQTLCYSYLYSKIVFLSKRRHPLCDWIPTGHEPQANEWILDNQKYFETMTRWSLCDLIPAKFSEKSVLLGNGTPCDENEWPRTYLLPSGLCPRLSWKWVCAQCSAHWPTLQAWYQPNPICPERPAIS